MNGHRPDCDGCVPCQEDACPEIAYCVNEHPTGNLCEHHRDAVCADHWPGLHCRDCRAQAEREMFESGTYNPRVDPTFIPTKAAEAATTWPRPPLTFPGSSGFRPRSGDTT